MTEKRSRAHPQDRRDLRQDQAPEKVDIYQEFTAPAPRQWQANQEAALAGASARRLPEQWTLESFPFKRQPGVKAPDPHIRRTEFVPG
jgi:hypothetical protein